MNAREALVLLNMTQAVGGVTLAKLAAFFGSPEAAIGRPREALEAAGLGPETVGKIARLRSRDLDAELRKVEAAGVSIVTTADPDYPAQLRNIFGPPPVLYYRGSLVPGDALSIAVVGSRAPSLYGLSMAKKFAGELAERGITVVSGMARGIDTQAHAGALEKGGRTIAVMGSGFNRVYPPENAKVAEAIAASGCVVSEFPMDAGPAKQNFPRRNRVISGLSLGVLVVEAGRASGSLITADFALEQGREVFAVPGRLDSGPSRGANRLIREGATLVSGVDDILEELPFAFPAQALAAERPGGRLPERRDEKRLYAIISNEGATLDELAQRSGMGICRLSALLLKMQLSRLIRRLPGNRFLRN